MLDGCCGEDQLAMVYCHQLISESLQESATAVEQLALHASVGLPQHFIQREAAHAFVDRLQDSEVKFSLFMGDARMMDEALRLEAAKAAAWLLARLCMMWTGAPY